MIQVTQIEGGEGALPPSDSLNLHNFAKFPDSVEPPRSVDLVNSHDLVELGKLV